MRHSLLNSFGNPLFDVRLREALADFGPEPEFVSHNTVKGLSGGQKKIKIVFHMASSSRHMS